LLVAGCFVETPPDWELVAWLVVSSVVVTGFDVVPPCVGLEAEAPCDEVAGIVVEGVVVVAAVVAAELSWDGLSVDNEDDIVACAVVAVAAAVVSVSVTTVTAMVGLVPGVVFPLQVWISPIEASSAFLQTEKFARQRSFTARMF